MIRLEGLAYAIGRFCLGPLHLEVAAGEYFVLLGPTGSGKTLLVECLCGLNRTAAGRVVLDGEDVTRLEPRRRRIGYLPQDYALFPHATVRQNIGFGLRYRGLDRSAAAAEVERLMELVGVAPLAARLPRRLSGGEKQRVALARALAIRPRVLVLDEPVSAVDESTRDQLCRELKRVQRQSGTTTLHVCHNFAEMLAVADRAAIIQEGRVVQCDRPDDLLRRPASVELARFVQAENLWPATAGPGGRLHLSNGVRLAATSSSAGGGTVGGGTVVVRPERIGVVESAAAAADGGLDGVVAEVVSLGPLVRLLVDAGLDRPAVVLRGSKEHSLRPLAAGQRVGLTIEPADVHFIPH